MSAATRTLAPCGTPAAYLRHRRRGEAMDSACRTANSTYQNALRRARRKGAHRALREQETAQAIADAARNPTRRIVRLPGANIALGALAGTAVAHGFLPDATAGTTCLVCFGWVNDYRHTHRLPGR